MMLRKKNRDAKNKALIRSSKPKFIRAQSGEFNFFIDEKKNQVSTTLNLNIEISFRMSSFRTAYH